MCTLQQYLEEQKTVDNSTKLMKVNTLQQYVNLREELKLKDDEMVKNEVEIDESWDDE